MAPKLQIRDITNWLLCHATLVRSGQASVDNPHQRHHTAVRSRENFIVRSLLCVIILMWTYHGIFNTADGNDAETIWTNYVFPNISLPFASQYQPLVSKLMLICALMVLTILEINTRLVVSSDEQLFTTNVVKPRKKLRRIIKFIQIVQVVATCGALFFAYAYMWYVFICYYPWRGLWPPYMITTPFWFLTSSWLWSRTSCVPICTFASLIIHLVSFIFRIQSRIAYLKKLCDRPSSPSLNKLRKFINDWLVLRKDFDRSKKSLNCYLAGLIPAFASTGLLSLYACIFLVFDWQTRSFCFTVLSFSVAIVFGLLCLASHVTFAGRRYALFLYQYSLHNKLDSSARKVLLKLIKDGGLQEVTIGFSLSVNYMTSICIALEGATYFLLLIATVGIPKTW